MDGVGVLFVVGLFYRFSCCPSERKVVNTVAFFGGLFDDVVAMSFLTTAPGIEPSWFSIKSSAKRQRRKRAKQTIGSCQRKSLIG